MKLLPILLATSLLLSACSIDWNDEKTKSVEKPEIKEDLFEKRQECEKYTNEAYGVYQKMSDGGFSIFYSPTLNTCIVVFIGNPLVANSEAAAPVTKKYIIDYLTKEYLLETEDGVEWSNEIGELKGEKSIDTDKEYEEYLRVINS